MQIQEVANELISQMSIYLSSVFSKQIKGYGIGAKDLNDNIVTICGDERFYIGITDNKGTFFYLRYTGISTMRPAKGAEAIGACVNNIVSIPIRAVIVSDCSCSETLLSLLQQAIAKAQLNKSYKLGQRFPKINFKSFLISTLDIFSEETGKDKKELLSNAIKLAAIDFELTFRLNNNICQIIQICEK